MAESSSKPRIVVDSDRGFRTKQTIRGYLEVAEYLVDDNSEMDRVREYQP